MAKPDPVTVETPPNSFPIPLDEFVASLPKGNVESAQAFKTLLKQFPAMASDEWAKLYAHFGEKPDGTPWQLWAEQLENKTEVTADGK